MEQSQSLQELMVKNIEEFSTKFKLPQLDKPGFLDDDLMMFRLLFIREEVDELNLAMVYEDLEDALDALVDIMYVVLGTAWMMNLPIMDAWDRVHAANMKKVRVENASESKRNSSYDLKKPEGWSPPDLSDLVT